MKYIKLFEEIKVYHGSGNKIDKFNIIDSKSGSTTYGYGYYFTDNEEVAKIYANENDDKYIYHLTLHKGKKPNDYDYLIFDINITNQQFNKIKKELLKNNINIDISLKSNGWNVIQKLIEYFYSKLTIHQQINNGHYTSKKKTSMFLLKCGIDGLKYKMPNTIISHEYGYDGYNYVVFDSKNIHIDKISKNNT